MHLLDSTQHLYPNSFQLRDDSLSLVAFKILLELSGAYLIVTDPQASKQSKHRKKGSSEKSSIFEEAGLSSDLEADDTAEEVENTLREEKTGLTEENVDSSESRTILYSTTRGSSESSVLVMVDLTKEIADQVCHYHRMTKQKRVHLDSRIS